MKRSSIMATWPSMNRLVRYELHPRTLMCYLVVEDWEGDVVALLYLAVIGC